MDELPERPEFRKTQREIERERRRIRDRERRSSMTLEQRERHLARRRRNYQLRRLRSRNVRTNPPFEQPSFFPTTEIAEPNSRQAETSIAELDQQRNGVTLIGFSHEQEAINPECMMMSSGSETLDPKAASLQGRVRLSHIRRVARSIIHCSSEPSGIHQILAQVNSVEESTCNLTDMKIGEYDPSRSPKALRLNRVKHLARTINSSVKASADPQYQTSIAEVEDWSATYGGYVYKQHRPSFGENEIKRSGFTFTIEGSTSKSPQHRTETKDAGSIHIAPTIRHDIV